MSEKQALRKQKKATLNNLNLNRNQWNKLLWFFLMCWVSSSGWAQPKTTNKNASRSTSASSPLTAGAWRGEITLKEELKVPFEIKFESALVKDDASGKPIKQIQAILLNGPERYPSGTVEKKQDTLVVVLDPFDYQLKLVEKKDQYIGILQRTDDANRFFPVELKRYDGYRFPKRIPQTTNIAGTYDFFLPKTNGTVDTAVGIFQQSPNDPHKITATLMRITGDARYLSGTLNGNIFELSGFIGSLPALYTGTIDGDGSIRGEIRSISGVQIFQGRKNAGASLPDVYALTRLKSGNSRFEFNLPNEKGKFLSSTAAELKGKVLIVTIGGTWCPNCMDEAAFLSPWYKANKNRGVEVIGLQFERQTDTAFLNKVFSRFRNRFQIEYPLLIGGLADKEAVLKALPDLQNFISFPTTLFIGKDGRVAKIHTGFTGPATGIHYEKFIQDFNATVDQLLKTEEL